MVPEDKGIVKTSTLEDAQTNLKFEDGDPKPVSTFSKLVFMNHIMPSSSSSSSSLLFSSQR
jgi:hypothetical protein